MYNKKIKRKVMESLKLLIDESNKIKAITKTRFLSELEGKKKNTLYLRNISNYIFSDLEGKDVEDLKEQLKTKAEEVLSYIDASEGKIIKNILKKVKNTHTVLTNEEEIHSYFKKKKKKKNIKINFVNSTKHEHIDLALVPISKIDSNANIFTNKSSRSLIEKANKLGIPVYCYTHSLNFIPKLSKKKRGIKPDLVKAVISELGIFEPEIFVQELKLRKDLLFF